MIKETIIKKIKKALKETDVLGKNTDISTLFLETPKHKDHGDFSTNIAFTLAKQEKKSPMIIAENICVTLNKTALNKEIQLTPLNGFINIKLTDLFLITSFQAPLKENLSSKKQHYFIEFVSANPTGPLHIGHGRWAVLGDVISRLLTEVGHTVSKEFYINDAGEQIRLFRDSVSAVQSGQKIPENGYHGHYVSEIANQKTDPVNYMIQTQKKTLSALDVEFDTWFSETSLHENNKIQGCMKILKEKGLSYEKDGATWFRTTEFGDDKDRVLIKKDSKLTYFAVDIAYHVEKLNRNCDHYLTLLGADHHGYVQRLKAAVSALSANPSPVDDYFHIIIGQLVSLYRDGEPVKMSKRTGEMITLSEVIEEIGSDATRFFLANQSPNTPIDFDLELAKTKSNDNPVFYIQYAYARLCSILRKIEAETEINLQDIDSIDTQNTPLDPHERALLLHSCKLTEVIEDAAKQFAPHKLCLFTLTLTKLFHRFYENCPIITAEEKDLPKRLLILESIKIKYKHLFSILGITALEKM